MPSSEVNGPLSGVRVLAMENFLAGNHATFLMSMFGADVIKVEQPHVGDALRQIGPHVFGEHGRRSGSELRLMGNKRSVAIDVKTDAGQRLLMRLVEKVDVFFTNQKPSSLESMGITFDTLREHNPRVIYSTLTGFGHADVVPEGPLGGWPAFDIIAQGLAGLQHRIRGHDDRPVYNGVPLGDEITSILTVLGTVSALFRRTVTGEAQRVDVAMHDAMVYVNEHTIGTLSATGFQAPQGRSGTAHPYGAYRTSDGWINIGIGGDAVWQRFCATLGNSELAADPAYLETAGRVAHSVELDRIVEEWSSQHTSAEAVAKLHAYNVPSAPLCDTADVLASPQVEARQMLLTVDDPLVGAKKVVGNPVKMTGLTGAGPNPPPDAGSDTASVLQSLLDLTPAQIQELQSTNIISGEAL